MNRPLSTPSLKLFAVISIKTFSGVCRRDRGGDPGPRPTGRTGVLPPRTVRQRRPDTGSGRDGLADSGGANPRTTPPLGHHDHLRGEHVPPLGVQLTAPDANAEDWPGASQATSPHLTAVTESDLYVQYGCDSSLDDVAGLRSQQRGRRLRRETLLRSRRVLDDRRLLSVVAVSFLILTDIDT